MVQNDAKGGKFEFLNSVHLQVQYKIYGEVLPVLMTFEFLKEVRLLLI